MPSMGLESSFDGRRTTGPRVRCKVLRRWEEAVDTRDFQVLLEDAEPVELSREIFGRVI